VEELNGKNRFLLEVVEDGNEALREISDWLEFEGGRAWRLEDAGKEEARDEVECDVGRRGVAAELGHVGACGSILD